MYSSTGPEPNGLYYAPARQPKPKPDWFFRIAVVFAAAVLAFGTFGCFMSVRQSTQFWEACRQAGGHIVDTGRGRICVSGDGRVIEP